MIINQAGISITNPDHPIVGYHNIMESNATVVATTEDDDFPINNIRTSPTHLKWVGGFNSGDEFVTITTNFTEVIDYLAIAGQNFAAEEIPISIEFPDFSPNSVIDPFVPDDDGPLIFRFIPTILSQIRLRLSPGVSSAQMAVVYVGQLLTLERTMWQGHTPINLARRKKLVSGQSESGNFLGRIITTQWRETNINLSHIGLDFYRTHVDPWIEASQEKPFFFGWRPQTYPGDTGYCWTINDPQPMHEGPSGLISINLEVQGIV